MTVTDDKLNNCKTVEEVEKLCCYDCAINITSAGAMLTE